MTESAQERYDKVGTKISEIGHLLQIVLWLQEVSITPRFLIYWVSKTHLLQLQEVQEEQHHYDELDEHYFEYCQWTDTWPIFIVPHCNRDSGLVNPKNYWD